MDGIGGRVRELRLKHGMTLQDLGEAAELSGSFLSQLERGSSSVSVIALGNICQALGVTLSEFFARVENVVPPELNVQEFSPTLGKDVVINTTDGAIKYKFISRSAPGKLEVAIGHFTKQDHLPLTSHEGAEYGYVLQGVLRLIVAGETYVIRPGNSYHFPSATPHQYEVEGDEPVTVLWVKVI